MRAITVREGSMTLRDVHAHDAAQMIQVDEASISTD